MADEPTRAPDAEPAAEAATIENLLREERTFPPPAAFVAQATAKDPEIYNRAATEEGFREFWTQEAERIDWIEPWTELLDWQLPYAKWFVGGKLNISVNCLDRHVAAGKGDKVAYYWEGEPGDKRTLTYQELLDETCRMANALRSLGVKKGDRVAIYMPMIPELPVAMLACARIGAPHSVVFGGFSADALAGRIDDAQCTTVITADGGYRKGATVPLKVNADDAMSRSPSVKNCVVVKRTGEAVEWQEGRDHDRYVETYWSRYPGRYFAGDGCKRDDEGYYWLLGRVDDVMNISGHRISTTEVESALVSHPAVAEAAVVGRTDPVTGQAIFCYVILRAGNEPSEELSAQLREHVAEAIGKLARPKQIMFTPDLPKTRSGKIMRRLLRDIAEKRSLGDVTTLADEGIVASIREQSGTSED
jgi:acyl-coenzyme A synthetase/AMP-(fatty) acid ligase